MGLDAMGDVSSTGQMRCLEPGPRFLTFAARCTFFEYFYSSIMFYPHTHQHAHARLRNFAALVALTTLLSGCATSAAISQAMPSSPTPSAASEPANKAPEQRDHTGMPTLLLTGQDQWGTYYTAQLKLTYTYNALGELTLSRDQEPMIDSDTPLDQDTRCAAYGAAVNQRTTWFPDTAVFVHKGSLRAIRTPQKERMALLPLTVANRDYMMVVGQAARKVEMAYAPCVGAQRVSAGHRTIGFAALGSELEIAFPAGKPLRLTLPNRPLPHVLLRYHTGAMVPAPMRISLITVDTERKRVVLQFQSTALMKPAMRVIEWRMLAEGDQPSDGETLQRYRERSEAMAKELAKCPAPLHPPEPCASADRWPDRKIFEMN